MNNTIIEQCSQFAEILGLKEPVSADVLKAAVENESYARNLLLSKENPQILDKLLQKPSGGHSQEVSGADLILKATTALIRWGKTGFTVVNAQILEQRENACLSCPHLRAPKNMLQQFIPSASEKDKTGYRTGKKVCDLCGCNVSNKIRLPTEACPGLHPEQPQLTRWGDPVRH